MSEAPNPGPNGPQGVQSWAPAEYADLVKAKGWSGPGEALKSYAELETFRGAPADRLIRIPDKPEAMDDAWRADVSKRLGYNLVRGPAKVDEYGLKFDGVPDEFTAGIAGIAHKHGIPVAAMQELMQFNSTFGKSHGEAMLKAQQEADAKLWGDRHAAAEAKLKERFGDKLGNMTELMTREATRLGFKDPAALEAFERNLAMSGDGDLLTWRSALADLAEARREAPFHRGDPAKAMSPQEASQQLAAKQRDKDWAARALTRGTPEAEENIRLNALASGATYSDEQIARLAKGLSANPSN